MVYYFITSIRENYILFYRKENDLYYERKICESFFKVWCVDADWFVDEGRKLGLCLATGKKTRGNIILGNTFVGGYGPKDKVDALCSLIKEKRL